jgi:hypothetical protein
MIGKRRSTHRACGRAGRGNVMWIDKEETVIASVKIRVSSVTSVSAQTLFNQLPAR